MKKIVSLCLSIVLILGGFTIVHAKESSIIVLTDIVDDEYYEVLDYHLADIGIIFRNISEETGLEVDGAYIGAPFQHLMFADEPDSIMVHFPIIRDNIVLGTFSIEHADRNASDIIDKYATTIWQTYAHSLNDHVGNITYVSEPNGNVYYIDDNGIHELIMFHAPENAPIQTRTIDTNKTTVDITEEIAPLEFSARPFSAAANTGSLNVVQIGLGVIRETCWAAACSSIIQYYTRDIVNPDTLCQEVHPSSHQTKYECLKNDGSRSHPANEIRVLRNHGVSTRDSSFVDYTQSTITTEIDNGRPIYGYGIGGVGAHSLVIAGYDYSTSTKRYRIIDTAITSNHYNTYVQLNSYGTFTHHNREYNVILRTNG